MANNIEQCPGCLSAKITNDYLATDVRGQTWSVFRCANCTLGFLNPVPSWKELAPYYDAEYGAYSADHGASEAEDAAVATAAATGELRHTQIRSGMRILDVGCGGGYFLRIARRLGAIVEGIEPSDFGVRTARKSDLSVFHGTLENYIPDHPDRVFDTITANHVLEHVPQPLETLAAMKKVLAPDGVIVIAVPNSDCYACRSLRGWWHSTQIPRHLMQFTQKSISECAARAGLRVESMKTYSLPKAVSGSISIWLRRRLMIPMRLSRRLPFMTAVGGMVGRRMDAGGRGEAIIVYLKHSSTSRGA